MKRLLTSFSSSYLHELREVQGRRLYRKVARIPAPALCPDIHSHTASCCCSPLAALSRPKELTAALCMHIYLSFKQRDTQKIVSNSMRTNILNPDAFTELLHLSDMLDQNCLFSTVTWLLLPDVLYFCHYCVWLRLKQTRNKLWTKRHHSKHCLFKASSLQSSSEQAIHLSPPWSTPLWTWPILQDPVCRQYTPVQLISAHHFYQQFHSLSFVVWERTTVASKLVHSPKEASFKQLSFTEETNAILMLKQRKKKHLSAAISQVSTGNTATGIPKNQGGERGEIFLIALLLNNIGRVQKHNLWSWNNNPK